MMAEQCFTYDIVREGEDNILRIDYDRCPDLPSIEDNALCMARTVELLVQNKAVSKIIFTQKRDYEYDFSQTGMLLEIAMLYANLNKRVDVLGYHALMSDPTCARCIPTMHADVQEIVHRTIKNDPLGAYVKLRRLIREERIKIESVADKRCVPCSQKFIQVLNFIVEEMEKTKMITIAKPYLPGYKIGDRTIYRKIFHPSIKPDFMYTKLMASYPTDGIELDMYSIGGDTDVTIFGFHDSVRYLYHMVPPEFRLSEEEYDVLDSARKIMAEHKPKRSEFVDPERMRQVFKNVGRDLIEELVNFKGYKFKDKDLDKMANILVRYTVGFGLIEVLLQDDKIQDISVNSPLGQIPIFIVHQDFDDCYTNIIPTKTESESWASKLRMISGRPLDEANQILDTELSLPGASTRVSAITEPLDPYGLAFSFRRHRDKPWTLPLFIKAGMVTPLASGLLSFLIDGTRTLLIAGTRSSGKSSFLGALLIEIMRRYRVITVEDTLELPSTEMRKLGYNIQPLKVASALAHGTTEMEASSGIRSTLRLGDSALIVGEIRSKEATALFEAMRVGAAANVVAGTIHSDSPYGVFDRVVNDIGVPKTSFKATDVIIVANPIKSADGLHKYRRVTQITEVRKLWEDDPMTEGGFVDLFKYDAVTDRLHPSNDLMNGDSDILKTIAGNIRDFAGNWDAVWENIQLRAKMKETLVKVADKTQNLDLLEAPFVISANDRFHLLAEKIKGEVGAMDSKRIFFEWNEWLNRECKKKGVK